jgi:hypothetical protein
MSTPPEKKIYVPQMLGLESLTKILIGYLKVGTEGAVDYNAVSKVTTITSGNIRRNANFLESIGLIEGEKGKYKLTIEGKNFAQALDWGRFKDAYSILRPLLENKEFIKTILTFININKSITRNDLLSRIAIIANVGNTPSIRTGINALVDMLTSCELINIDNKGMITISEQKTTQTKISDDFIITPLFKSESVKIKSILDTEPISHMMNHPLTISIVINVNGEKINLEEIKKLIQTIKEVANNK